MMNPIIAWIGLIALWGGALAWGLSLLKRTRDANREPISDFSNQETVTGEHPIERKISLGTLCVGLLGIGFVMNAFPVGQRFYPVLIYIIVALVVIIVALRSVSPALTRPLAKEHPWRQEIEALAAKMGATVRDVRVHPGGGIAGVALRGVVTIRPSWLNKLSREGQRAVFGVLVNDLREGDKYRLRLYLGFGLAYLTASAVFFFIVRPLIVNHPVYYVLYMALIMSPQFLIQYGHRRYLRTSFRTVAAALGRIDGLEEWLRSFPGKMYAKAHEKLIKELRTWFSANFPDADAPPTEIAPDAPTVLMSRRK